MATPLPFFAHPYELSIPVAPVARGLCFTDVCLRLAGREPYTLTQVLQPGSIGRPIGNSVMFCSL